MNTFTTTIPALAWWIVVGAAAGWFATAIIGTVEPRRPFIELVVGIVGALLAGLSFQTQFVAQAGDHLDSATIVAACAGACVLLALWRWVSRRKPVSS